MNALLIKSREALLRAAFGSATLNNKLTSDLPTADLPSRLANALKALKAAAIDERGAQVDYTALRQSAAFAAYQNLIGALPHFDPTQLVGRAEQLAFWINLYNCLVLHAVIAFAVRQSVAERAFGLAFFRRAAYSVGGVRLCCDDIEHGILRANAGHPFLVGAQFAADDRRLAWVVRPLELRLHFALNCASRSCPPIGAYDADQLERQLTNAARFFVDQETALSDDGLRLSAIFKWYARDFGGQQGVRDFLLAHLPEGDARHAYLQAHAQPKFSYASYDWALNGHSSTGGR
mgnify:CR=1 FL=1